MIFNSSFTPSGCCLDNTKNAKSFQSLFFGGFLDAFLVKNALVFFEEL